MAKKVKFGSPNARDMVAQDEKTIKEAAAYGIMLDEAMMEMQPRSLGSVKVPPSEQMSEWEMAREAGEMGDPSHLGQLLADNCSTLEETVRYAKAMEKKRAAG